MVKIKLAKLIRWCQKLKKKLTGVFAADNFRFLLESITFNIVCKTQTKRKSLVINL